jgi:hypothetical protein
MTIGGGPATPDVILEAGLFLTVPAAKDSAVLWSVIGD